MSSLEVLLRGLGHALVHGLRVEVVVKVGVAAPQVAAPQADATQMDAPQGEAPRGRAAEEEGSEDRQPAGDVAPREKSRRGGHGVVAATYSEILAWADGVDPDLVLRGDREARLAQVNELRALEGLPRFAMVGEVEMARLRGVADSLTAAAGQVAA